MKRILCLLSLLATGSVLPQAGWAQQAMKHAVVSRPQDRTVTLDISPNLQLRRDPITGITALSLEEGFANMDKGAPDLPHFSHAFITGDTMITAVGFGPYLDYPDVTIAPSKGPVSRLVDPRSVPAQPGPLYQQDRFYPETPYEWGDPYQVRGLRGRSLRITPVQYNPVRKILRVYQSLSLTVYSAGVEPVEAQSPEWSSLLRGRFLNADAVLQRGGDGRKTTNYTPAGEEGNMLIVAPGKYRSALQPFVRWKAARGIRSWLVNTDSIAGGATPVAIKALVAAQHSLHNIDFVLFVGSPAEVPVISDPAEVAGASYAAYSYLNGNDHYPDLLTGVFSVNSEQQLQTLVERSIRYEREPATGADWYGKAIGIASEQGPGDDNEMDYEHMRNLRSQLMQSGYTAIGEYYDGSQGGLDAPGDPVPQDIVSAVNAGAGLMNYCGHGWEAGLGTSGFSIQQLPQLTNNGALPFLMTVACNTGDFSSSECLAQAITRKTGNNGATGAVAAFCSSISQYWNQPMEAQDEVVKIISGGGPKVYSLGAITACGVMQMNDAYGSSGEDMTDTWILFGDPSLQLRSRQPDNFQVSHLPSISRNATGFDVSVAGNPLATVVLLYHDSILSVKHCTANSPLTQHSFPALQAGDSFQVWVTAPNAQPYSRWVRITAGTGVESSTARQWTVYPQPADYTLTIRGADKGTYALYDAAGRRVANGSLSSGATSVGLGNLPAGSYLLELRSVAGGCLHQQVQVVR